MVYFDYLSLYGSRTLKVELIRIRIESESNMNPKSTDSLGARMPKNLDDGRHPKYEFWAPNPYYTNYIRHDGARFKELFKTNLGMSLNFF